MADPDFRFTSGDVGVVWKVEVSDENGPIDLTGATGVQCIIYAPDGETQVDGTNGGASVTLTAVPDVDQATNRGHVSVTFGTPLILPSGDTGWKAKFVVTTPGWTRTFPTRPHKTIRVDAP